MGVETIDREIAMVPGVPTVRWRSSTINHGACSVDNCYTTEGEFHRAHVRALYAHERSPVTTRIAKFGSLGLHEKGCVDLIDDDAIVGTVMLYPDEF